MLLCHNYVTIFLAISNIMLYIRIVAQVRHHFGLQVSKMVHLLLGAYRGGAGDVARLKW